MPQMHLLKVTFWLSVQYARCPKKCERPPGPRSMHRRVVKGRILLDYARFKRTMATKNSHFKVRGSVAHRDRNHTIGFMLPPKLPRPHFMTRVQGSQHQRHQRRALREQRQQIRQCTIGHKSPKGAFLYICARTQSPPSRPAPRPCDLPLPDQWLLQALHGWKYGEQRQAPIASETWAAATSPAIVVFACTPRVSARDAARGDGSRGLIA